MSFGRGCDRMPSTRMSGMKPAMPREQAMSERGLRGWRPGGAAEATAEAIARCCPEPAHPTEGALAGGGGGC